MNTNQKIWTFFGAIVAITGVAVLFIQEKYIVGSFLILVLLALLFYWLYKKYIYSPLIYKKVHFYYDIKDKKGHLCEARKENYIISNSNEVNTLVDCDFTSSGQIKFVKSNMGSLAPPKEKAGTATVKTNLDRPTQKNE